MFGAMNPKLTGSAAACRSRAVGFECGREEVTSGPRGCPSSWLCDAGDGLVLDAEMTVVTADGRADFELLSIRILRSRSNAAPTPPVNVYVFDLLRRDHNDLIAQPWEHRRVALEALDLNAATDGRVRPVPYSTDGEALRVAMEEAQGEGLCHKLASSRYIPGKRSTAWRKTKFRHSTWLPVIAWRPPTPSKPAGLLVVDAEGGVAIATAALPVDQRQVLAEFLRRYGRRHPTVIPGAPSLRLYRPRCATPAAHRHMATSARP
jgi:ATP-dependent DNA ligase